MPIIDYLKPSEYQQAMELVARSFWKFDAAEYSEYGRSSFLLYASHSNFTYRQRHNHVTFAARVDGELAGILELRNKTHISMLFVDPGFVKCGCGRALVAAAVSFARKHRAGCSAITVNSSPYALAFYRRLGFFETEPQKDEDGFLYTPMQMNLTSPAVTV